MYVPSVYATRSTAESNCISFFNTQREQVEYLLSFSLKKHKKHRNCLKRQWRVCNTNAPLVTIIVLVPPVRVNPLYYIYKKNAPRGCGSDPAATLMRKQSLTLRNTCYVCYGLGANALRD